MERLSANSRRQIDSVLQTTAGKETLRILTANIEQAVFSLLFAPSDKMEGIRGEVRGQFDALKMLSGKKVVLRISLED